MKSIKTQILVSMFTAFTLMPTAAIAAPEITLGLSNWPGWVAWYVAKHNGYFKEYHAHFKLVWFSSYMTSVEALSAGKIDANCQALIDTIAPVEKGVPIKVVLTTDNSAGNDALMVSNNIKTFKQLEGKTIAVRMDSIEQYLDEYALKKNDVPLNKVSFTNMSTADAAAALMAGRVGAAGVWNPWIQRIEQRHTGHVLFSSASAPGVIPDIVAANKSIIKKYPEQFVALAKVWYKTVQFIDKHPQQAAKIMAPHVELSPTVYQQALAGTHLFGKELNYHSMNAKYKNMTISLYKSTEDTGKFLLKVKAINKVPDPSMFIDPTCVNDAIKK
ncbi:aliphatic sulfonate ABC transporter substrate-binding protein [Acidithiobacillus sp. M4-SHS-6]|uniref:aliphatic sulfonate ABC transporter substrate-binding protein n=1 Tax=Acidithiobacillus sp. M4-SHS-6 TaxID=3383024 RepID=UPI0039BDD895